MSIPLLASATELARLVRTGQMSPVELVTATLERIQALNPALNAYVGVDSERALDAARSAERKALSGEALGPLHGVPVSIKSSVAVHGLPWETGTRFRQGVTGDADAPLVSRLRSAGAIVVGVTNVAEQLMAWETDNALYGQTRSPWALDRTPGGSSGGEAAAIAAGLSAGGVGSDGGGSIRVPAHFSGICGLKPTPGRVPATGHFPPCGGPFALTGVVGPMARTVDDVETLLEVMAGPDIGDPNGHPVPFAAMRSLPAGTRVGVFEDDGEVPVTAETREAVRQAARWLADAGCEVEPFRPDGLEEARVLWWEIFGRASRLILEPHGGGPRSGGAPESRRVPRLDTPDAEAHGGAAAGSRDPPRSAEVARARADGALSAAAVPRRADPRVPPRRAHVDDRGEDGALSRRVALHARGSTCSRIPAWRCPCCRPRKDCRLACSWSRRPGRRR